MAKLALYKRNLFHPKTIMNLVNLGECVIVGENETYLYRDIANNKWIVRKEGIIKNNFMETDNEEMAVKSFWNNVCEDKIEDKK